MSSVPSTQKLTETFYTPEPIAAFLCDWAIVQREARVLDPAAGDGVFLATAAVRFQSLGGSIRVVQLTGIDLGATALAVARE